MGSQALRSTAKSYFWEYLFPGHFASKLHFEIIVLFHQVSVAAFLRAVCSYGCSGTALAELCDVRLVLDWRLFWTHVSSVMQ